MLRAYALADLFSANLDSIVEGLFLCTTSGSLIGLSPQNPSHISKRLAVLGALTWRFHWASIRSSSSAPRRVVSGTSTASSASSPGGLTMATTHQANGTAAGVRLGMDRTQPLPVLRAVIADEGTGLQELTVQYENRLCSMEYVKEGLIVGAFSRPFNDAERQQRRIGLGESSEDASEEGSSLSGNSEDESSTPPRTGVEGTNSYKNDTCLAQQHERLARSLSLKASAMAEYLREELRDFKMPKGLD